MNWKGGEEPFSNSNNRNNRNYKFLPFFMSVSPSIRGKRGRGAPKIILEKLFEWSFDGLLNISGFFVKVGESIFKVK